MCVANAIKRTRRTVAFVSILRNVLPSLSLFFSLSFSHSVTILLPILLHSFRFRVVIIALLLTLGSVNCTILKYRRVCKRNLVFSSLRSFAAIIIFFLFFFFFFSYDKYRRKFLFSLFSFFFYVLWLNAKSTL